jgi:hypothetical protein
MRIIAYNPIDMKRLPTILVFLTLLAFSARSQNNVGINDNNSSPKASAMLDVYSTSKGLLIPRIALTSTTTAAPVTSPEASLLVYNSATTGDVTPGYYYWDGSSKWVRLVASADPAKNSGLATKTASATLLKTENMVLASGDITLTLPAVTSADNGLEITVKNIGTYTDLITVIPQSTKTIDAVDTTTLTRWQGITYIASETNWILKNKDAISDNLLNVSESGSFTTIGEVVEFLGEHMSGPTIVMLGGGTYTLTGTQTISFAYPVTFEGISFGSSEIVCPADGSTAFNVVTECYFKMVSVTAGTAAGIAINFSGAGAYYEVKDANFVGFTKAIRITGGSELWLFETDFENCTTAGVEISTSGNATFKISECDFINCAKGINMDTYGTGSEFSVTNCNFYNTAGQTGIVYVPGSTPYFNSIILQNNSFNNIGTFSSGFDFSRTDGRDANVFFENNAGVPSERPHCKINVVNNAAAAQSLANNTWTKASFTNTSNKTTKWTIADNRITYQSLNKRNAVATITGSIMCTTASNQVIDISIVKNGVTASPYGPTSIRTTTQNQPYPFSIVVYIEDLVKNDYLEIFLLTTPGTSVKISDVNWFTDTI